ncbi:MULTISPECIES: hypothetical protein [unclassified Polaromonas]|jgi:hypothetical protein|uniref:hypothetical protein n=1 Tax=unclassified Polaromonas TaxID=2638319 RepID=UPI000BC3BBD6|nr:MULTISPECIES: hypothetical protein [unclassified Polaromonas]OYY34571.1 MAG: hypothetical protein B7Y60_15935 [Polaromonas sp. 35-63-35]OYZ18897.1 MAG: hypothetical protein B7Y28_14770 [Polaromonas sp. 16-63-31]OYZ78869.1 MAG: hypothetical protein B7Y09_11355 [Polaromonas sp. 24-63-21]OZA49616.1 MAG: hypothetical protein B7X88_14475 [Polaromonas sp. 17-63-33]OZA86841.1 MAG: hypothetical protein B7X65_15345 [Polaromonas sp. 39-63-25]
MKTAEAAYADHQAAAKALLARLARAVDEHAGKAKAHQTNWGYVGDLDGLCGQLIQGLGMLDALTEAERQIHRF